MRLSSILIVAATSILLCVSSLWTVNSVRAAEVPAQSRTIDIGIARLRDDLVDARDVRLLLSETPSGRQLALSAALVEIPTLDFVGKIDWQCGLTASASDRWSCAGPMHTSADTLPVVFRARIDADSVRLELQRDDTRVVLTVPLSADGVIGATAARVPVTWLKAPTAKIWSGGQLTAGTLDASVKFPAAAPIDAQFAFQDLTVATNDGALAGDRLNGTGTTRILIGSDAAQITVDAQFTSGLLREGTIEMRLPESPVGFGIDATGSTAGIWDVSRFEWHDQDALELEATARIDPAAAEPFIALDLSASRIAFPQVRSRLTAAGLRSLGIADIDMNGSVSATLGLRAGSLTRLAIKTDHLDLRSKPLDTVIAGIVGGVDWAVAGNRPPTTFGWKSIKTNGLAIGDGLLSLATGNGQIELARPATLAMLGGTVTLRKLTLDPRDPAQPHIAMAFDTDGIGYDSAAGTVAAAGIRSSLALDLDDPFGHPKIKLAGDFHGGEALYGPVYVKLPATPVTMRLAATAAPDDAWKIDQFSWTDPGVVDFSATATIAPTQTAWLPEFSLDVRHAELASAADRYAKSWLAATGYADLLLAGSLSGSIAFTSEGMQHFDFTADGVDAVDGAGRFALRGFSGAADWHIHDDRPVTTLGWTSLDVFNIPLGATQARLQSVAGREVLTDPADIPVLGGHLLVQRLNLNPRAPRGQRYRAGLVITGIAMPQLSRALEWPEFGGTLAGAVPDISFDGDVIKLGGGLFVDVFGGTVDVTDVTLERPFAVAPSFGANIRLRGLDLKQVTSAFSFGEISGKLDGDVRDLRLLDWSPTAFDASLSADDGGRMSYNAVNSLSSIGGGGLGQSLQTMALKVFNTFGYRRLGVACRLVESVCHMSGLDAVSGNGFTIVQGSGIPRITIVGFEREVDWQTLVERLKEATSGAGPIVQ